MAASQHSNDSRQRPAQLVSGTSATFTLSVALHAIVASVALPVPAPLYILELYIPGIEGGVNGGADGGIDVACRRRLL